MKRSILGLAGLGMAVVTLWAPAEDAGACSIWCPPGTLELELVEVRLVEAADPELEPEEVPEWPTTGTIDEWGGVWFDDNTWLQLDGPLAGEEL